MKVFKDNDGEIYLTKEEIPIIERTNKSKEMKDLLNVIKVELIKKEELYKIYMEQNIHCINLENKLKSLDQMNNIPTYKPTVEVQMSTLKVLSKLGYKHIVMPDVFLRGNEFQLSPEIKGVVHRTNANIIGEVYDKVIIYSRKPTRTSSIYKHGVGRIEGRELKWIAEVKVKSCYFQIYLDENKVRLGEPGSPMKYDDIKSALSGLFYIDRTLNYKETKQLILTEMTKQLLKGK